MNLVFQAEVLDNKSFQCGTICTQDNCTVLIVNSLYSRNIVTNDGAAVLYGERWCDITNVETIVQENTGPGADGIIILKDHGSLENERSTFR